MTDDRMSLEALNAHPSDTFAAALAPLFEGAAWVTEGLAAAMPYASLTALHAAALTRLHAADADAVLAVLRGHPALSPGTLLAGTTPESDAEQRAARLHTLDAATTARLDAANAAYLVRFGFPFILAVRQATVPTVFAALERRTRADPAAERAEALQEVAAIGWLRLLDRVRPAPTGGISLHVLDTGRSRPAAGLLGALWRVDAGAANAVASFTTDAKGRAATMLGDGALRAGTYEWRLDVAAYAAQHGASTLDRTFLPEVVVRFAVWNPEEHFHVPVLLTQGAYTAYRGS